MAKIRNLQLLPPKSEADFEELCLALWKRKLGDRNAQFVGRRGQGQDGVDLFGRRKGTLDWVGVQCKVRTGGVLTEEDVGEDAEKARKFNPRLSELVFATTAPRDKNIQEFARKLTEENERAGLFPVMIFSWNEIERELGKERNLDICRRFYQDYFVNYEKLGIAISRVLQIEIGVGKSPDTQYPLIIGKTPPPVVPGSYSGLDYWKGIYFIINLNEKRMGTFPVPTFDSDLETAFQSARDRHIITKWLNSIESIDDLIYGDEEEHSMLITEKELRKYSSRVKTNKSRAPSRPPRRQTRAPGPRPVL